MSKLKSLNLTFKPFNVVVPGLSFDPPIFPNNPLTHKGRVITKYFLAITTFRETLCTLGSPLIE